jgi:threonine synthase
VEAQVTHDKRREEYPPAEQLEATQPDTPPPLLDSVGEPSIRLPQNLARQREVAADRSLPVTVRAEAFEDIIDSEVGDTDLLRARNIEREVGLRQVWLKFEGGNPTGTQKDRIAFAQAMDALRRGYDTITVATCGNYGTAIATAAHLAGLRCLVFVPSGYHGGRIDEMRQLGSEILRSGGDYESAVSASRARAERDEFYDANPGGANTTLQLRAYGEIAYEIYDDLRDAPAVVAVPVSNGTTLAGIHRGFLSLYRRGKTSRMPRIVAGSSYRKNPIVDAVMRGLDRCADLHPERIRETTINEPLINWHSIDGDLALAAVNGTGGWGMHASDRRMRNLARVILGQQGLNVLPASTAGLHALLGRHERDPLPGDRYVAIITARRS